MDKKKLFFLLNSNQSNGLRSGIVSYWNLDSNANDSVGSNNGVATATPGAGIINGGYVFPLTTRITVPDNSSLSFGNGTTDTAHSWSVWIKPTDVSIFRFIITKRQSSSAYEYHYYVQTDLTFVVTLIQSATQSIGIRSGLTLTLNAWNHVVATYSGSGTEAGISIYINGVLSTGNSSVGIGSYTAMNNLTGDCVFGAYANANGNAFVGSLDEIGLWSKKLTQAQVTSLYNSGAGLPYSSFS